MSDLPKEWQRLYKAIRRIKQRSVDIVMGIESCFKARKEILSVEKKEYQKGCLCMAGNGGIKVSAGL